MGAIGFVSSIGNMVIIFLVSIGAINNMLNILY